MILLFVFLLGQVIGVGLLYLECLRNDFLKIPISCTCYLLESLVLFPLLFQLKIGCSIFLLTNLLSQKGIWWIMLIFWTIELIYFFIWFLKLESSINCWRCSFLSLINYLLKFLINHLLKFDGSSVTKFVRLRLVDGQGW